MMAARNYKRYEHMSFIDEDDAPCEEYKKCLVTVNAFLSSKCEEDPINPIACSCQYLHQMLATLDRCTRLANCGSEKNRGTFRHH